MILTSFGLAVAQFLDPRFRRVLWLGIGLSLALLVAFYAGFLWLIAEVTPDRVTLPFLGEVTWLGDLLGWGSALFLFFMSMFLMIPVASAITSLFLDDVAEAVEAQHYPALPPAGRVGFAEGLHETLSFLLLMLVVNVVTLAATLILFAPAYPLTFYLANGWLLGREYFQIAAIRRESAETARALRRANFGRIWLAGCLMALPLSVPILNLAIPVLGAATFTHLYHRMKAAA